jgi:hypothetical protein
VRLADEKGSLFFYFFIFERGILYRRLGESGNAIHEYVGTAMMEEKTTWVWKPANMLVIVNMVMGVADGLYIVRGNEYTCLRSGECFNRAVYVCLVGPASRSLVPVGETCG